MKLTVPTAFGNLETSHAWAAARPARVSAFGPEIPRHFFWLSDILTLVAAFYLAYLAAPRLKVFALAHGSAVKPLLDALSPESGGDYRPINEVAWILLVMVAVTLLCIQWLGGYRPLMRQSRARIVLSTVLSPLVGLSSVTLILFTLRSPSWSRLFVFLFAAVAAALLCAYRLEIRSYRRKRVASGFYARNVLFIGPTPALEWLAGHFATTAPTDYVVVGYLSLSPDQPVPAPPLTADSARCLPRLGGVDDLAALVVHRPIHEVVAVSGLRGEWLKKVIEACDYFRLTLRIVPEALLSGDLRDLQFIYRADPLRLPEVVLRPQDLDSGALFVKRVIDVLVAATLLVLLLPVFALIALGIKLTSSKSPVFYPWKVVGYKGKRFTGYKFSTMGADADARKADLMHLNEMTGPVFKITNDPRVTCFGRLLRKYSLNELPQLWSVLKGDMSLVGPRPAGPHELPGYEVWHKRKLCVRPGITCLWQVRGRNRISHFDDWVRMDLEYIDNWSLWLDFKILVRTVWVVLEGSGS